ARRGARVGLIARSETELESLLSEVGGRGAVAVADVGDRGQVDGAIAKLEAEMGPIDILVANAGVGAYGPFADIDVDEIERLMRINYLGTAYAIRAVLPGMIERGRGHIVIVGSIAGRIGAPFEAAYSATKFAQVGLAEAISFEAEPHGVGVSLVNPGIVETDFFAARGTPPPPPPPKPVSAERVADAVIRAVEQNRFEQVVPRWLRQAVVLRHNIPPLLRWGTRRRFAAQLSDRSLPPR
nr:SDR family NAD(P)-dependent oxidoreductase [Actinomycetota bacterium]